MIYWPLFLPRSLLLASVLLSQCVTYARGDDKSDTDLPKGYPQHLHDKDYDFVLGKVDAIDPPNVDSLEIYHVTAISDMRGAIKNGSPITIRNYHFLSGTKLIELHALPGQVAVFFVKAVNGAWQFDYYAMPLQPFGLEGLEPTIPAQDVTFIVAAFKELKAAAEAPAGELPSHARALELLTDKNPYLWAIGCWRLSWRTSQQDLETLVTQFKRPGLTGGQAIFLDDLFDHLINGDVELPMIARRDLLRDFIRNSITVHPDARRGNPPPDK